MPACPRAPRWSQKVVAITARPWQQELLHVESSNEALPGHDPDCRRRRSRATQSSTRRSRRGSFRPPRLTMSAPSPAASRSRTSVTSSKKRGLFPRPARCGAAAGRPRRCRQLAPGRADMTTTRVERKTASGIEWVTKTIVELSCASGTRAARRSSSSPTRSRRRSSSRRGSWSCRPGPGRVAGIVEVDLPQPRTGRTREEPRFFELVTDVRERLAAGGADIVSAGTE